MAIFFVCYSYGDNSTSEPIPVRFETKQSFKTFLFVHFLTYVNKDTVGVFASRNVRFGQESIPWGYFTKRQVFTFEGRLFERYDFCIEKFHILTPEEYYDFRQ